MKTKHTPGPWRVVSERTRTSQGFSVRGRISDDGRYAPHICETMEDHETVDGEANARAIALVPDLVALARYVATHNCGTNLERRAQRLLRKL